MNANLPAYLFQRTVNVQPCSARREETLSTGSYVLVDVGCRLCGVKLGWKYLAADNQDQKYKENCVILQQALLQRVRQVTQEAEAARAAATRARDGQMIVWPLNEMR